MSHPLAEYALIGDRHTGALVSSLCSIDWLCLPRFDSGACFAALLGDESNGYWKLAPTAEVTSTSRRYRDGTLILETELATAQGRVRVIDAMPHRHRHPTVIRIVEGLHGEVEMECNLRIRFDYGWVVPWVWQDAGGDGLHAVGGPDALHVRTPVPLHGEGMHTVGRFTVRAGQRVPFVLAWHGSSDPLPPQIDPEQSVVDAERTWRDWSDQCTYKGPYEQEVKRSLVILKALTYEPSGGIVAALTTSLPEQLGGVRNWDYRYSWLRDATFTLYALTSNGYLNEAQDWRQWLLRAAAGDPAQLQTMYGVDGERRLTELELDWLSGYEGSRPVRTGNGAATQFQLDVYGEVMDALHAARRFGLPVSLDAWALQLQLVKYVERHWQEPDEGIWEVRGGRRHFTYSKVMAWVAFDRAAKGISKHGLPGDATHWRALADTVHADVCDKGFDPELGTFVQSYGSKALDASLLLLPLVGFLPPSDPRIVATLEGIQRDLTVDGLILRYHTDESVSPEAADADGLPGNEGSFLICSFWLVDNLALQGRITEAIELFERLAGLSNDVGLFSEEYDPVADRMLGNMPQAFSHVGLINSAHSIGRAQAGEEHPRSTS